MLTEKEAEELKISISFASSHKKQKTGKEMRILKKEENNE